MRSPMSSNLIHLIGEAIDSCFYNGSGKADNGAGLVIYAEWVDSKRPGYSVMHLTIARDSLIVIAYDDYGTECVCD